MFRRIGLISLFILCSSLMAGNYADTLLEKFAAKVANPGGPVDRVLLAEEIYYLSHETSAQEKIGQLLTELYESSSHGEVKSSIGYFLTQHLRQLGKRDEVSHLIKDLGYVSEWRILGPLEPQKEINLKALLKAKKFKGMGRNVYPHTVRTYGAGDNYWDQGLGHYGYFSANHIIFPNQLVGTLYTTWFHAPEKGTYRFGLGWNHIGKLWINRTKVIDEQRNQFPNPDQEVVNFEVGKGWHRITLYIESASENPNLGFFARLTDQAGNPIDVQARPTGKLSKKKASIVTSEPSLLDLAQKHSEYALATLLLLNEQHFDETYGTPQELLVKAFNKNPSRTVAIKLLTLTENHNERLQYLQTFLNKTTDNPADALGRAWAYTEQGQIALNQSRFWEARKLAKQAIASDPDYWPASLLENNTLSSLDLDGQALRETRKLYDSFPGVPWLLMDLSDLYWSLGYFTESEKFTDNILDIRRGNTKFAERKVALLKRRGDMENLDKIYRQVLSDSPYSINLITGYAQFLMANERYDQSEAVLDHALAQMPENPTLLESMGELHQLKGSSRDALAYFEQSLAIRPQNPALEKRIALTKAEEETFYEPYRITAVPEAGVYEVAPIITNIDNVVTKVARNGQSSVYHQLEWEVATEKGITELPGYSFSYAPLRQKAQILKAEVYRGDQTILLTQFGRSRVSDPAYRMYYDVVAYQIPFPTLEVGDRISLEYRIDDADTTNIFGDYFGDMQYFAANNPIRQKSYTLIVPKDLKIHYHVEKMEPEFSQKEDKENRTYTWTMKSINSLETESRMPGVAGYLPYVGVSTFDDWQDMASWYHKLIENQLVLDGETKAIVKELVAGLTDKLEIVKKIHEYVITQTRYVALEFGIHGYKPYQVNQVCSRQFGDCKDKASLIISMLREAGVDASIVITRTSDKGKVHNYPAMLTYFNHAIAYVPDFDLYLDGTAEFSGIYELPDMDQGAMVLIVDKEGKGTLTEIPVYKNNHQTVAMNLAIAEDGLVNINGEMTYEGSNTPQLRQYLSIDAKLTQNVARILGNILPGLAINEANRKGKGINEPITLTFQGETRQLVQKNEDRLKLSLGLFGSQLVQSYVANSKRKFPLALGPPKTKVFDIMISAPDTLKLAEMPESVEMEDDNFKVRFTMSEAEGNNYKMSYEIAFKDHQIEPSEYESLRNLMQAHDRLLDKSINFVKK